MSIVWGPIRAVSDSLPACPVCRSHRTRIVGQSGEPPYVHFRCEDCGHVFSRPLREEPAD